VGDVALAPMLALVEHLDPAKRVRFGATSIG
jgi:hypothetical protein